MPSIYLDVPHMFGCAHMFGHPPYVWTPPYVWMPSICLNAPHTSVCPYAPLYICIFLVDIYIWYGDGGIYTPHIECSDAITRIMYKKHYKFVHVGKHKYLNKTPYDLYGLFIYLPQGGLGGIWIVCLMNRQTTNRSNRAPSWTSWDYTDEQLIQVIWDLGGGQGGSRRGWGLGMGLGLGI